MTMPVSLATLSDWIFREIRDPRCCTESGDGKNRRRNHHVEFAARRAAAVQLMPSCPRLTYFLLTATGEADFPHLAVAVGDKSTHDLAWNFDFTPMLERALPGDNWNAIERVGWSNFSKPGCTLASAADASG